MKIDIEAESGFCFGVSRAIELAEDELEKGNKVYCLGEIVHNRKEVERLLSKGLVFIDHDELKELKNSKVLIRAHGEPPSTYELAGKNNLRIIDGTCPIVRKLQKRIKEKYLEDKTGQILIYGKQDHPEVIGLNGQTEGNAVVIREPEMLSKLHLKGKVSLFSQTTMDTEGFKILSEKLSEHLESERNRNMEIEIHNTICRHISHRQPGLIRFANEHDVIIFVSGKNSSNGRILFDICKKANPESHLISESHEIRKEWFDGYESTGICGATSTPKWLLQEVYQYISDFTIN